MDQSGPYVSKFTVTSNENVLTSHWTSEVAVGPVLYNVTHPTSQANVKLNAGKRATETGPEHTTYANNITWKLSTYCSFCVL